LTGVSGSTSTVLLSTRYRQPSFEKVQVVDGVVRARSALGTAAAGGSAALLAASGTGTWPGSQTSPLSIDMGFLGYEHRGSTPALANINPEAAPARTVTVKVRLLKGFTYSVGSTFEYIAPSRATRVALTVQGPQASRAQSLNQRGGSFTAQATGEHSFTWALPSNGSRFDGAFSASISGREPPLPRTSGNRELDALVHRPSWWHDPGTTATVGSTPVMPGVWALSDSSSRREISYSFIEAETWPEELLKNDFPAFGQSKQFVAMSTLQREAVRAALDYVSAVTQLRFVEASDGSGNLQLGSYDMDPLSGGLPGLDGVSNLPGAYPLQDKVYTFINANPGSGLGDASAGTPGWGAIWHELGHALGLKHPGNYDAAGSRLGGPFMAPLYDNRQYSIMSYRDNVYSTGAQNLSYMLYDVAALQYLYGVNSTGSTASGDVAGLGGRFTFASTAPRLSTLYSGSGKDVVDLSGLTQRSLVNLNAGSYSSINIQGGPGPGGFTVGHKVAIAYGSQINKVLLSTSSSADSVVLNNAFRQGGFNEIANLKDQDRIVLSKSLFGRLTKKHIEIGHSGMAQTRNSRIVVNQSTGDIFYDPDGAGTRHAAVKVASYQAVQGTSISASSFSFLA